MKLKNCYKVFKDQLPFSRMVRNLLTGNILGVLYKRSHQNESGKLKVMYNTKESAIRSAESMGKKTGKHFSNYKCLRCDGYHVGKNRDNK